MAAFADFGSRVRRSTFATLAIKTKADSATTQVRLRRSPTLGIGWGGISVVPFDSDGFRIWTDSGDVGFQMQLRSTVNNLLSATCELWWDTQASQYESAGCVVPDTSLAGSWELEVSLHDGAFYSTSIHVKCATGFYEVDHASFLGDETMWTCAPCPPNDATCLVGSTLSALPLQSGFWRAGADRHIHQNARSLTLFVCVVWTQARNLLIFEVASSRHSGAPPSAIPLNAPTGKATTNGQREDGYCACAYTGPLYATCERKHFTSWAGSECTPCGDSENHVPTIILAVGFFGCALVMCCIIYAKRNKIQACSCFERAEQFERFASVKSSVIFYMCHVPSDFAVLHHFGRQ
jgi:hypothetical protein